MAALKIQIARIALSIMASLVSLATVRVSADPTPFAWQADQTKVLIVSGGSSHDFKKWFEDYDEAFLKTAGFSVNATEDPILAAAELKNADVAIISTNNEAFDTPEFRAALLDFVARGKGVVMLHPATWYNFRHWPEFNAKLVGGGTRSHDEIDSFKVSVLKKDHPVMAGVPADFEVTDELYHINPERVKLPADTASIDVLAQTSVSKKYKSPHPSVWIPKSDAGRIVCIALGHDGRVHQLQAFQTILINAVKWTAGK